MNNLIPLSSATQIYENLTVAQVVNEVKLEAKQLNVEDARNLVDRAVIELLEMGGYDATKHYEIWQPFADQVRASI